MVKHLAEKEHSAALAQSASRISAVMRFGSSAGEDPLAKVRALISDMFSKLEAEACSEATEKICCDEQLAKTEAKNEELNADIAKRMAKIGQAAAASATWKSEVQQLQGELAELTKSQAVMDSIRREEHALFLETKTDLELGLEGVLIAIGVLREYYGSAEVGSMLQAGAAQPRCRRSTRGHC